MKNECALELAKVDMDVDVGDGSVDFRGRPSNKSTSGGWKAAYFIMGVQLLERTAYYSISLNLITYLVQVLHQGTAQSSTTIYNWAGVAWILPLLGGFLADAYTGQFWMIFASAVIYLLGLILMSVSMSVKGLRPPDCPGQVNCKPATEAQVGIFYFSIYVVAVGCGGIIPCLSPFGANQFNEEDDKERRMKRSFFNYWGIAIAGGGAIAVTALVYVQDHVSWGWGYAVPAFGLALAIVVFLSGTTRYRNQSPGGSPLTQIAQVFTAAIRNRNVAVPADDNLLYEVDVKGKRNVLHTNSLRLLDKAAVIKNEVMKSTNNSANTVDIETTSASKPNLWRICPVTQVEEVKLLVRVLPIWIFSLMFMVHITQLTSFFLRQGMSMDTSMGPHFKIPPASLTVFNSLTAVASVPLYDRYFVPWMRKLTGNERGISMLQRIGTGLALSTFTMGVAALVEMKRLRVIKQHGLEDQPGVPVPMSVFWLLPQYIVFGVSEIFVILGQIEFFYDQAPDEMPSIGTALYTSNTGVAHFLSTAILQIVTSATSKGGSGWIVNNLNRCRIDKWYWTLAALGVVNFLCYVAVARWYTYKMVVRRF